MKTMNYVKITLLLLLAAGLASCGDTYEDDYLRNSSEKLCGRHRWVEDYVTTSNEACVHSLEFSLSGSGKEVFAYYRASGDSWSSSPYRTDSYSFTWNWINNDEGLLMYYGADDTLYFDNVWVRDYYLSGYFEGREVTFYKEAL